MKKLKSLDVLVFPVTYHCDARCIMCTIPQRAGPNLSPDFFRPFLEHKNVSTIKSLNLTGGEPTLRSDLPEMVKMVSDACPRLQEILLNSNGLNTARVLALVEAILAVLPPGIKLWVFISLDSVDEDESSHTRGVGRAAARAKKTIVALAELRRSRPNLEVAVSCTITRVNCASLRAVFDFAAALGLFVDFIYATVNTVFINSKPLEDKFVLDAAQRRTVAEALRELAGLEGARINRASIEGTIRHLLGERTHSFCIFAEGRGALLEPTGVVRTCGMMEEGRLGNIQEEPTDAIFQRPMPDIDRFCAACANNNYVSWGPEAQHVLGADTLNHVRAIRQKRGA